MKFTKAVRLSDGEIVTVFELPEFKPGVSVPSGVHMGNWCDFRWWNVPGRQCGHTGFCKPGYWIVRITYRTYDSFKPEDFHTQYRLCSVDTNEENNLKELISHADKR